jgi:hypothetical protein
MVMVKRSLEAAKAIIAGNSVNLITSVNMASAYLVAGLRPVSSPYPPRKRRRIGRGKREKAPARDRSPLVTM